MTFLFWNLCKRPLQNLIADLVEEHQVDVLLLVENKIPKIDLLPALNRSASAPFYEPVGYNERVSVFTRLPQGSIISLRDHLGVSFRRVSAPIGKDFLLVVAHLPSKMFAATEDHSALCQDIARMIGDEEERLKHFRSLIVGDLNMNPFEPGVAAASYFHGVMSRQIAKKHVRTVQGAEHRFFYNPMWARFGDNSLGPPGTYYYTTSGQLSYFWHMFDQVLVRPDLLDCFRDEDVQILTKVGSTNLLTPNLTPNDSLASDHLPLLFKLHLESL